MNILALDPGPEQTAWMLYDGKPIDFGIVENHEILSLCDERSGAEYVACECLQCFGMPVGKETFETAYFIGKIMSATGDRFIRVYRSEVKMHLCHTMRAKDANISQALKDRYGGKAAAIGNKKNPGPLYGVTSHSWSALSVAVTAMETKINARLATA